MDANTAIATLMDKYHATYAGAGTALITALIGRSARIGTIGVICDIKGDKPSYTLIEL